MSTKQHKSFAETQQTQYILWLNSIGLCKIAKASWRQTRTKENISKINMDFTRE